MSKQHAHIDQQREDDMAKVLEVIERGPSSSGVNRRPTLSIPAVVADPQLQPVPYSEPIIPTSQSPSAFVSLKETLANKLFIDASQQTHSKPETLPDQISQPTGVCANGINDSQPVAKSGVQETSIKSTTDQQESLLFYLAQKMQEMEARMNTTNLDAGGRKVTPDKQVKVKRPEDRPIQKECMAPPPRDESTSIKTLITKPTDNT